MSWASSPPTSPGWYWLRNEWGAVQVVRVVRKRCGGLFVELHGTSTAPPVSWGPYGRSDWLPVELPKLPPL